MDAYARERAECSAEEEARADRRLRAWRLRQMHSLPVRPYALPKRENFVEDMRRLRDAS